jgi:ABC-type lipopolysaccharide export system ATPase subunit
LADGRIVASGSPKEIVQSDIAKKLYLGESFSMD